MRQAIFRFLTFLSATLVVTQAMAAEIHVVEPIPIVSIDAHPASNQSSLPDSSHESLTEAKRLAQGAAVLDSISTRLALSRGGTELNPLVNTSPIGLAALALGRVALMEYADANLSPEEKAKQFPLSAALSVGAVINNAVVLGTSITPLGIISAAAGGMMLWQYYRGQVEEHTPKETQTPNSVVQKELPPTSTPSKTFLSVQAIPIESLGSTMIAVVR